MLTRLGAYIRIALSGSGPSSPSGLTTSNQLHPNRLTGTSPRLWNNKSFRMLASSVLRVARSPAVPFPAVTPAITSTSNGLLATATRRQAQRRYSSSKPPVPPSDGSRGIDTSQTAAKGVNPSGQKRDGKSSRRKGRDNGRHGSAKSSENTAFLNLPSVPSTQHRQPHGQLS